MIASPVLCLSRQMHVARVLAAEQPAALGHLLQHVAVANLRALERDALTSQRLLEAQVAHQRADDAAQRDPAPLVLRSR